MQKRYLILILVSVIILAAVLVVSGGAGEEELVAEDVEEVTPSGEDVSSYFNVAPDDKVVKPDFSPTPATAMKCRLNGVEVDAGTVIDGTTCIAE